MAITETFDFRIAPDIQSASPHEVKLVDKTIDDRFLNKTTDLLIDDKAYDSDPLDKRLKDKKEIEMIATNKSNRKKPKTQNGRKL